MKYPLYILLLSSEDFFLFLGHRLFNVKNLRNFSAISETRKSHARTIIHITLFFFIMIFLILIFMIYYLYTFFKIFLYIHPLKFHALPVSYSLAGASVGVSTGASILASDSSDLVSLVSTGVGAGD